MQARLVVVVLAEESVPDADVIVVRVRIEICVSDPERIRIPAPNDRSGPRFLDSGLSEISTAGQAAAFTSASKYTASGVRRSSAVWRRRQL